MSNISTNFTLLNTSSGMPEYFRMNGGVSWHPSDFLV